MLTSPLTGAIHVCTELLWQHVVPYQLGFCPVVRFISALILNEGFLIEYIMNLVYTERQADLAQELGLGSRCSVFPSRSMGNVYIYIYIYIYIYAHPFNPVNILTNSMTFQSYIHPRHLN